MIHMHPLIWLFKLSIFFSVTKKCANPVLNTSPLIKLTSPVLFAHLLKVLLVQKVSQNDRLYKYVLQALKYVLDLPVVHMYLPWYRAACFNQYCVSDSYDLVIININDDILNLLF